MEGKERKRADDLPAGAVKQVREMLRRPRSGADFSPAARYAVQRWLRRVRGGNFGARPEANREAHSEYNWRGRRHRDRENGVLREAAANGRLLSGGRGREFASLYTVGNRDAVYPRARR